jgi:hypothetical protein
MFFLRGRTALVTAAVVVSDLDKDAASAVAGQVLPVDGGIFEVVLTRSPAAPISPPCPSSPGWRPGRRPPAG